MSLILDVVTTGEGEMNRIFLVVNFEVLQGHLYYVVISSRFPLSMSDCVPYILRLFAELSFRWYIRSEMYTVFYFLLALHIRFPASSYARCLTTYFSPSTGNLSPLAMQSDPKPRSSF
jgi:hypothetical protein